MNELFFVLKSLLAAFTIVTLSQIRFNGNSLEEKIDQNLKNSKAAIWIQGAAAGGALAIGRLGQSVKDTLGSDFGGEQDKSSSPTVRAEH